MKYFYKHEDNYSGFCATLNNTINVCFQYYKTYNNYILHIDIPELNKIFNFNSIIDNNSIDYKPIWEKSNFDNSSNAHTICDKNKIIEKNHIFNTFFQLRNLDFYQDKLNKFITPKTLGIHIRGTDKFREVPPPNNNDIISHIENMLNKHDINNIYLATDDRYYQDLVFNRFGNIITWNNKKISEDRNPIHFINDRTDINIEVMTDVFLLSNCNYLLYCFSNVSYSALIMGINNFKDIDCLNKKKINSEIF
jgi:hypothetical protein